MARGGSYAKGVAKREEILERALAVADGIQIQWMRDPAVDMAATIDALLDALTPAAGSEKRAVKNSEQKDGTP